MNRKEWLRSLKFVLFSASAGIIQMGSFALLNELVQLDYWLSYLISMVLSVVWNFTFNRKFTFKSTGNVGRAMMLVALYYCAFTPLSTLLEHYLADTLAWNEYIVTFLNMLLNMVTEFLFQRFVVYRNSVDNNEKATV
jgi:putative flippase GtrA